MQVLSVVLIQVCLGDSNYVNNVNMVTGDSKPIIHRPLMMFMRQFIDHVPILVNKTFFFFHAFNALIISAEILISF